ncbi:MAG: hypothetical protein WBC69_01960, partial [Geitlerinemataceae cyanobacterium]
MIFNYILIICDSLERAIAPHLSHPPGLFHCRGKRGFCRGSAKSAYPATDEIMGVPEIGATTLGIPGRLRFAPTENETAL